MSSSVAPKTRPPIPPRPSHLGKPQCPGDASRGRLSARPPRPKRGLPTPPPETPEEKEEEHLPASPETADEVFIAVMGATGSGKSTFINLVSGSDLAVDAGLRSCTTQITEADSFKCSGKRVILVDTPGFDDTTLSDTEILKRISVYLSSTYQVGFKLSGIIYMYRISDRRVTGVTRRNFSMFRKLCGDETLKNVMIVTNMWGSVTVEEGEAREHQLRTDNLLFKPALDEGARILRHDNTMPSAQKIIGQIVDNRPIALCIQREIVEEGRDITQTTAGAELDRELVQLRKEHERELAGIHKEIKALAGGDSKSKGELEQAKADMEKAIARIQNDRDCLSREFEKEKARADATMKEIRRIMAEERAAREEMEEKIEKLQQHLRKNALSSATRAFCSVFSVRPTRV